MKNNNKKKIAVKCCGGNKHILPALIGLFILIALSVWISGCVKNASGNKNSAADPTADNLVVPLPQQNIGNLNAVPKEELDSLFGNIKK